MADGRLTFFTDENISHRASKMLEAFDQHVEVRAHGDSFDQGTADIIWLEAIAGWTPKPVVLAGDGRILRNKAELQVLKSSDLMFVYLAPGWTNVTWADFAWKIIKVWPGIVSNVRKMLKPSVFEVSVNLKVELRGAVASLQSK